MTHITTAIHSYRKAPILRTFYIEVCVYFSDAVANQQIIFEDVRRRKDF
jgi:hypothetical protein